MALTVTEQGYYDHAKQALPRFLFELDTAAQEQLIAFAVMHGAIHAQALEWLAFTYIATATGVWLDQHARDRGTSRRDGESNAALRLRLATLDEVVTVPALMARINEILADAGYGTATMVETRGDGARFERSRGFFSRGYRRSGGLPSTFVVILPYPTDAATAATIAEYVRKAKGAGFKHVIETRATP